MEYTSSSHSRLCVVKGTWLFWLFILRIGNDDLVASDGWMIGWLMNCKLKTIWKGAFVGLSSRRLAV